jgi:hypothetical protein
MEQGQKNGMEWPGRPARFVRPLGYNSALSEFDGQKIPLGSLVLFLRPQRGLKTLRNLMAQRLLNSINIHGGMHEYPLYSFRSHSERTQQATVSKSRAGRHRGSTRISQSAVW